MNGNTDMIEPTDGFICHVQPPRLNSLVPQPPVSPITVLRSKSAMITPIGVVFTLGNGFPQSRFLEIAVTD